MPGAIPTAIPRDTTKPIAARTPTDLASAPSRVPLATKPGTASATAASAAAAKTTAARAERSRFRALHRLWKHPLGEVHGGTDATTGARVLVTALHAGVMIPDRVLEAAQQVAREAAALTSPFIAKPIDVQRLSDGRIGIATEALEGTPLTNVSRNQPLPSARVYAMLRQICRALALAHEKEIVHRAISLGSVLLRARAERTDSIVLTDFALGPLLDADLVVHKEDAALQPVTPERISGQERDAREDMYLLGCLGYTLLTGGAPFRTGTADAVRRRHAIEDPMPVTDRLRGARSVPVALAGWVHRCLAKEPDDRFENAAELEAALCFAQIEDRVQTAWDDLAPPQVDPVRQERILDGLQHRAGARPTIDDQVTTLHSPEYGTDDDDGDKTIVRAPTNAPLPVRGAPAAAPAFDDRSRSIVLEQDAAALRGSQGAVAKRERHEDTVDAPAPRQHEDTVDAPPPTEETIVMRGGPRDETNVGPMSNERHDETIVGSAARERDETSFEGLIAEAPPDDVPSDDVPSDDAVERDEVATAAPPASKLPSEQDTFRGPAPVPPTPPPQLQAVRAPMPTAVPVVEPPAPAPPPPAPPPPVATRTPAPPPAAVAQVVRDEEDSLGDLQTRISHLPLVRDGNTVIGAPPLAPTHDVPSPSPTVPAPLEIEESPTGPIVAAPPEPFVEPPTVVVSPSQPVPPAFVTMPMQAIPVAAPTSIPAAPMPVAPMPAPPLPVAQMPAPPMPAAAPPAPTSGWGLPPPTIDAASLPGATPAAWGPAPVDAEMSMMGSTDFGRTRRLVVAVIVAVAAIGIIVAFVMNNRQPPPPPPPAEPAGPAVTVKPTTPVRPRDPAFDTATTAAEFAVAGERAYAEKRIEDAEDLFQAAIVRDPKHVGALLGLGRMRGDANDWTKAAAYYQRAVNAAPKDGTARIALGDAFVKLGKIKDAKREYKKAKQLGHPEAAARSAGL